MTSSLEYIPFQELPKAKLYKILHYGKHYSNYCTYMFHTNIDGLKCIYVDNEPCSSTDKSIDSIYYTELHYNDELMLEPIRKIMLGDEVDAILETYGCRL